MTTSNPDPSPIIPGSEPAIPEGLPDASKIARMAGDYFPEFNAGSSSADPVTNIPLSNIGSDVLLDSADMQGFAADHEGLFSGIAAESGNSFGFLETARPLFDDPARVVDKSAIPNSAAFKNGPQIPGAPRRNTDFAKFSELSFVPNALSNERAESVLPGPISIVPHSIDPISYSSSGFDVNEVRRDFPILSERVNGRKLVWLDNAATTQKPQSVIDRLSYFYAHENSNVHRGAHTLAARSTDAYEAAREKVRGFLNAPSASEIIFVRGTTEGINLVAQSWGRQNIGKDDEIIITWLEHHANIVPWQMLCAETGAKLRVVPVDETGQVLLDQYERALYTPHPSCIPDLRFECAWNGCPG
jgi:cysteine desulfurase/selenocysteine lyase